MDILAAVQAAYPNMTKTEKKIADYILQEEDGHYFIHVTLKQLADNIGAGQASIMRMINTCGYSSYRSFMAALSQAKYQESARKQDRRGSEKTLADDWSEVLQLCQASLNQENLQETVRAICEADYIVCTGYGNSSHIASLAASHLRRCGLMAQVYIPGEIAVSPNLHPQLRFVLLAFSISGETDKLLEIVTEYRENRQFTVALTGRTESSLAKASDVTFFTPSQVAYRMHGRWMDGMMTQLFVIETIAAEIKKSKYKYTEKENP